MIATNELCPADEDMKDAVWEKNRPEAQKKIEEHCRQCPSCRAKLKGLYEDRDMVIDIYKTEFLH